MYSCIHVHVVNIHNLQRQTRMSLITLIMGLLDFCTRTWSVNNDWIVIIVSLHLCVCSATDSEVKSASLDTTSVSFMGEHFTQECDGSQLNGFTTAGGGGGDGHWDHDPEKTVNCPVGEHRAALLYPLTANHRRKYGCHIAECHLHQRREEPLVANMVKIYGWALCDTCQEASAKCWHSLGK